LEPVGSVNEEGYTVEPDRVSSPDSLDPELEKPRWYMRFVGILCCLLSSIIFSLATIVVKSIQSYHAFNISFYRFQGVLVPSLIVLAFSALFGNKGTFDSLSPKKNKELKRTLVLLMVSNRQLGLSQFSEY
jgi:hypothetical protein